MTPVRRGWFPFSGIVVRRERETWARRKGASDVKGLTGRPTLPRASRQSTLVLTLFYRPSTTLRQFHWRREMRRTAPEGALTRQGVTTSRQHLQRADSKGRPAPTDVGVGNRKDVFSAVHRRAKNIAGETRDRLRAPLHYVEHRDPWGNPASQDHENHRTRSLETGSLRDIENKTPT